MDVLKRLQADAGLASDVSPLSRGPRQPPAGHPAGQLPIDEGDDDADVRIDPGDSTAGILAFYSRSRAAADQVTPRL